VRHLHPGQLTDHRLKFEDGLERSLGDLGLVRRVSGEEFATGNQRVNDDRTIMVIGTSTEKAGVTVAVFAGTMAEPVDDLRFRHLARDIEISLQAVLGGNGRKQIINRARADVLEHGLAIGLGFGQIAHRKFTNYKVRGTIYRNAYALTNLWIDDLFCPRLISQIPKS